MVKQFEELSGLLVGSSSLNYFNDELDFTRYERDHGDFWSQRRGVSATVEGVGLVSLDAHYFVETHHSKLGNVGLPRVRVREHSWYALRFVANKADYRHRRDRSEFTFEMLHEYVLGSDRRDFDYIGDQRVSWLANEYLPRADVSSLSLENPEIMTRSARRTSVVSHLGAQVASTAPVLATGSYATAAVSSLILLGADLLSRVRRQSVDTVHDLPDESASLYDKMTA